MSHTIVFCKFVNFFCANENKASSVAYQNEAIHRLKLRTGTTYTSGADL